MGAARSEALRGLPIHKHRRMRSQRNGSPETVLESRAPSPSPLSRTPTYIFQSDDVGVLPIPQKNLNLFRGISLALVDDLRRGVHVVVSKGPTPDPLPATEPTLQGVESQPHTFHPSTEPQAPTLPHQRARATWPPTSTPPSGLGRDKVERPTLTAYSMVVALWTQRLHSE